jgi:hypothetical protein
METFVDMSEMENKLLLAIIIEVSDENAATVTEKV